MTARRWMRRTAMLACLLGLAVLGAGWLAIGAVGKDEGREARPAAAAPAPEGAAKLPPLPSKLRPKVVEPEAGAGSAAEPAAVDPSGARATGSRRQNELGSHSGYVARHPPGL